MTPNKAFTLVEILLVVIIIGIVIALAVPNFSKGFSSFELDQTADDLLSVSRWAQAMAIGQERVYALSFSSDQRTYGLVREKMGDDNDSQDKFEPVQGPLGRKHMIPAAIQLEITQISDSKGKEDADLIEFYPDGTIDAATLQLNSSAKKIVLSSVAMRGMMTKVDNE